MDSFYDAPRRPPQLFIRDALTANPVVPDISVLCASNVQKNTFTPYTHWKMQQTTSQKQFALANKENFCNQLPSAPNGSILKKQVRFEGPVVPVVKTDGNLSNNIISENKETQNYKPSFEQMYMANIPNRKLDLSVIDLPTKKIPRTSAKEEHITTVRENNNKEGANYEPKTYKAFLEAQKAESKVSFNDSVTDIFNYKRTTSPSDCSSSKPRINVQNQACSSDSGATSQPQRYSSKLDQCYKIDHSKDTSVRMQFVNNTKQKENTFAPRINSYANNQHSKVDDGCCKNMQNVLYSRKSGYEEYKKSPLRCYRYDDNHSNSHDYINSDGLKTVKRCENCDGKPKTESYPNSPLSTKFDDDISAKDLLKIISQQSQQIALQNEQLLLLQKQISTLICRENDGNLNKPKSIEFNGPEWDKNDDRRCMGDEVGPAGQHINQYNTRRNQHGCLTSTQHEDYNEVRQHVSTTPKKNKNKVPNFSIGVMTSFEVSIRNSHNKGNNKNNFSPKIQEIVERKAKTDANFKEQTNGHTNFDNNKTLADVSMMFKEPIRVREQCPSPEPSIKISMNDFEDSDCEDEDSSEIGATFYNNLMAQVNKILQKAQIQTREELAYNYKGQNAETVANKLKNETIHKVKEATLKHLRNIGVEVPIFDDGSSCSSDDPGSKSYDQEDISFTVKQLLMKYLPDDHLAKISKRSPQGDNPAMLTPKEKIGAIKNRPEFSFATVQYMKKYNLMSNGHKEPSSNPKTSDNKILDMTKLKQQPKLL